MKNDKSVRVIRGNFLDSGYHNYPSGNFEFGKILSVYLAAF